MNWADHYSAIYDEIGVEAQVLPGNGGGAVTVTALDKTSGVVLNDGAGAALNVDFQDIRPGAIIRMSELTAASLVRSDLHGGEITINDVTWHIESSRPRPAPTGEANGELLLILMKA